MEPLNAAQKAHPGSRTLRREAWLQPQQCEHVIASRSLDQSIYSHLCHAPWAFATIFQDKAHPRGKGTNSSQRCNWGPHRLPSLNSESPPMMSCSSHSRIPSKSLYCSLCLHPLSRHRYNNMMTAGHAGGFGLWLQDGSGAQTLALSRKLPGACLFRLFYSAQSCKGLGLSQTHFLSIPIIFIWSVGPEHTGPTVGLLFLANSFSLVCPGRGAGSGGQAGRGVHYQLNPNPLLMRTKRAIVFGLRHLPKSQG